MTLAAIGSAIWRFLKGLPWQVWAVVLAGLTGYYIDQRARGQQKTKDTADQRERELEEQARLNETINQIGQETEDAKDRALDAPSRVDDVGSADELRERYPANAKVILRTRPPSGGSGPR